MAEQSVDLRSTLSILRRHRLVLVMAALVGVGAGVGFGLLHPPMYASTSQVLLPPGQQSATGTPLARDVNTEIRIATSDEVLGPAGQAVTPPMSIRALGKRVKVSAPTTDVLVLTARADTPARAEALSRALAQAEVDYETRTASSLGNAETAALDQRKQTLQESLDSVTTEVRRADARQNSELPGSTQWKTDATALSELTAQQASLVLQIDQLKQKALLSQPEHTASIIQAASPAKRPGLVQRFIIFSLLGVLLVGLLTASVLVLRGKRDRSLRYRDEMADALGSPVVGSFRSRTSRNVAGWSSLLADYAPGPVDAWAMRQALRQLAIEAGGSPRRHGERGEGLAHPTSVTVISLSDDLGALALGPQLAAYAASAGLHTRLVAAQRHESAAALWAACGQGVAESRPGLEVDTRFRTSQDVDLTVVLRVVDRSKPELGGISDVPQSTVTVLAVSSGSATAEELALTAVNADDGGNRISGILVADPDDLDRTTGRLLRRERAQQVALPTHLTGVPGPGGGGSNVSGMRRRPR